MAMGGKAIAGAVVLAGSALGAVGLGLPQLATDEDIAAHGRADTEVIRGLQTQLAQVVARVCKNDKADQEKKLREDEVLSFQLQILQQEAELKGLDTAPIKGAIRLKKDGLRTGRVTLKMLDDECP